MTKEEAWAAGLWNRSFDAKKQFSTEGKVDSLTESESLEELDLFIAAMRSIAQEVEETPELVKNAPHSTRVSRLDEVTAARKPILRWKPQGE